MLEKTKMILSIARNIGIISKKEDKILEEYLDKILSIARNIGIIRYLEDRILDIYLEGGHICILEIDGHRISITRTNNKNIVSIGYMGYELKFEDMDFFFERFVPISGYLQHYVPKSGDVVIDGGAFVGFFSIIASKLVGPSGKVLSFEPDPKCYDMLVRNINLNGADNIIPLRLGLYNHDDILSFHAGGGPGSTLQKGTFKGGSEIEIEVVSLDNELLRHHINGVDFIKLDIEGSELFCIEGSLRILSQCDVKLAIASYHVVDGNQTCWDVERKMSEIGYESWTEYTSHLTTYAKKVVLSRTGCVNPGFPPNTHKERLN